MHILRIAAVLTVIGERVTLLSAVALLLAACPRSSSDARGERPDAGAVSAFGVAPVAVAGARHVAGGTLYVTNEDSNDVTVIDLGSEAVTETIDVGKRPRGIRLSPDGRYILVAVSGSPKAPPGVDEQQLPPADKSADGVTILDTAEKRVVQTIAAGSDPESFDLSPDGRHLYVSNEDIAKLSIVELGTAKPLAQLDVGGEPEGVTTRPDGAFVYVTSEENHRVDVVDAKKRAVVATIATGKRPRAIIFSFDGKKAWVTNENDASVTIIDAEEHRALKSISFAEPSSRPMGVALSPDGGRLYVSLGRGRSVAVIDTARDEVIHTIHDVGIRPWGVAVSPDGRRLFTANGPSNDVTVIDTETFQTVRRIPVGKSPWGLAVAQ